MDSNTWTHQYWLTRKTYIYKLCVNIGCCLKDLPSAMVNRDGFRESMEFMLLVHLDNDDDDK